MGSWTYVLITPDGLVTGSLPWLLDKLRAVSLEPVGGWLVRLKSATMLGIYDTPTRTRPQALPPSRAFDLWYGLGPGCVLLLHRAGGDACAAMLEVKGATDPRMAREGSIRHSGENVLMNLVHCPDDEAAASAELPEILGNGYALDLPYLALSPNEQVRLLTVESLGDALPAHSGREALSLPLVVNKLRLRMVQRLAVSAMSNDAALSALVDVRSALGGERNKILEMTTSPDRVDVARALNDEVHDCLADVAQRLRYQEASRALRGLSASLLEMQDDWPGTLAAIRNSGIYISDTESAVLELDTLL